MRASFLAEVSAQLASSLDYQETLKAVAALVVPRIADWCGVDLLGAEGRVERLAIAHVDPARIAAVRELQQTYPGNPETPGSPAWVIAHGESVLVPQVTEEMLVAGSAGDEERLRLTRALGISSYMCVPLRTVHRTIGSLAFALTDPDRRFSRHDLQFAEELARRAAIAIENAHAYDETRRANQVKDEFLATLSHELRTPLNAILGYARMVRQRAIPEEGRDRALGAIERNANVLAQIVGDVLDVSRIVSGKLVLARDRVNVQELVAHSIESIMPGALEKHIAVHVEAPDAGPIVIEGDPERLQQVLWNVLSNAVKFTPDGGSIRVTTTRDASAVSVSVNDSGIGISRAFLANVFQPFQQADTRSNRDIGGLGLGLAIARRIVELHDGTITVESEGVGRGSVFVIRLPLAASQA